MSYSWRERLRLRRQQLALTSGAFDWIERYIEQYCAEADRQCKEIDANKAVDLIIDEMNDAQFDQFSKGVIDKVTKRLKRKKKTVAELRQELLEEQEADSQTAVPSDSKTDVLADEIDLVIQDLKKND